MSSVVILDDLTINKIAAGEVVDRPSSIVKELIENSIDANATSISIEIKNGGISYIKIVDNGDGFKSDDVEIAFERHATSKIRCESDILNILSMGFRGEALASVASISKVELITKNIDEYTGTKIKLEAGNVISKEEVAYNKGSAITIRDIFFNTPARFKFLKKDYTEASYIYEVIVKLAMSHSNIAFKYINNNKEIINTLGNNDIKGDIYNIFGNEISSNTINVSYTENNINVSGVIGNNKISRSSRTNEYTYVNNRYIKNKIIMSAIEKAYDQNIAINKYPFVVLNININPNMIDINVHPSKLEIKFSNESEIYNVVYNAVKSAISKYNESNSPFKNSNLNNISPKKVLDLFDSSIKTNINNDKIIENNLDEIINYTEENNNTKEYSKSFIYTPEEKEKIEIIKEEIIVDISFRYVGSIFNTYCIIEVNNKIYIVDRHAAHERLLYEKIKENYYSKDADTQLLSVPVIIELKQNEIDIVNINIEIFKDLGYEIEKFDDKSYKISGIPNDINLSINIKEIFLDLIDELEFNNKTSRQEKEKRFLYTLACKAAVKANMSLNEKEDISLLNDLIKLDNPFTCPHGRPIAYEISKYEIEKNVSRK